MYVGFGSNLGDRLSTFKSARRELAGRGYRLLRSSRLYETEPWGGVKGGRFLNAVLEIELQGTAHDLLSCLREIEAGHGRRREERGAPRTCDLDLLLWGDEWMETPELQVPHPRMNRRRFVLVPLCDLIPDVLHPVERRSFGRLLELCSDPLGVWPYLGELDNSLT